MFDNKICFLYKDLVVVFFLHSDQIISLLFLNTVVLLEYASGLVIGMGLQHVVSNIFFQKNVLQSYY